LEKIAQAISQGGGNEAVQLQLTQQYLTQLGKTAVAGTRVMLPMDLTSLESVQRLIKEKA
jgi:hypothetical protein